MNNKKILVTGGYGFIGSNFINYLIKTYDEFELTNIDYLGFGSNISNVNSPLKDTQKINHIVRDLYSYPDYLNNKQFDVIVHFAAESHVDRSIISPMPFIESNVMGTLNMLEYTKNSKSGRFIYISTDEVYGSIKEGSFKEDAPLNPSSAYSASKASGELLCNSYNVTHGLDIIITRCSNNFGPNQFEEKLIPKVVYNCINNLPIPVYDEGLQRREWTYVETHVYEILLLIEKGISGETYNVGLSRVEKTNIDIVNSIINIMGASTDLIQFIPNARLGHDFRYSINTDKLLELHSNKNRYLYEFLNLWQDGCNIMHDRWLESTVKDLSTKFKK